MCGFSGFISNPLSREKGVNVLRKMGEALVHRGPDGKGVWISEDGTVGLAHQRLSVIEPSDGGRQPMFSPSGRYAVVYNGEIYNYQVLRAELERVGFFFDSKSDTEVLLTALEHWGCAIALEKFVGMFAFALWDQKEKKLVLARDRFGEKPLYYGWQGKSFLFGSTVQSLKKHPDWRGEINRESVFLLSNYNYIPAPNSIYCGIKKLSPGTWLELVFRNGVWEEKSYVYWSTIKAAQDASLNPFKGSYEDASIFLEKLLKDIVKGQMFADVPLGAFLSGGIDSSAIVALMQSECNFPVSTFTVGFDNPAYDESSTAELVAGHLGTSHTTHIFSETDIFNLISVLPKIYDEPFADASQLPTALISEVARREVTVSLSGDGGDEIFGGYNRYIWGEKLNKNLAWAPQLMRNAFDSSIRTLSPSNWDSLFNLIPATRRPRHAGEKLHKLAKLLSATSTTQLYKGMVTFWSDGNPFLKNDTIKKPFDSPVWNTNFTFVEQMMLMDTLTYLPDDILVKVDRAAMSVGLETRVPFLDHRLFEFAWSLPMSYRIRDGKSKSLLRSLLCRYVPRKMVERPKSGFALPIGQYLRGPLREWAESLLNKKRLSEEGYFDESKVRMAWDQHLSGRYNRQHDLWSILMFQAWLDH